MLTGPDEWGVDRPLALAPWKGATLWQWTDHGHSPGIAGDVDLDRSVVADKGLIATHVAGEHDG